MVNGFTGGEYSLYKHVNGNESIKTYAVDGNIFISGKINKKLSLLSEELNDLANTIKIDQRTILKRSGIESPEKYPFRFKSDLPYDIGIYKNKLTKTAPLNENELIKFNEYFMRT